MCQLFDGECRDRAALEIRGCQRGQGQGPTPAPSTEEAGGAEGTGSGLWLWERQGRAGGCREQDGRRWVRWGQSKGSSSHAPAPRQQSSAPGGQGQGRDRLCPCGFKSVPT